MIFYYCYCYIHVGKKSFTGKHKGRFNESIFDIDILIKEELTNNVQSMNTCFPRGLHINCEYRLKSISYVTEYPMVH